ncbi:phenylacetate-CoA ligase [Thiogranum longum]|uniref:Phenylacetate-CoA ligase n=1 Tax=Thiogranum longum TaxID=1537524 RepID=A0A4R1HP37_9GAMM|nr:phenylacetate--CoA ligase family protein [Thiogranum longum]TCK19042.1 phenylacetate-CoA ligase [Thiogranum longum]
MIGKIGMFSRLLYNRQLSPKALQTLQLRKLQATVAQAYDQVPYYRHLLDEAGVTPGSIGKLDDLKKIPVSTKDDLRKAGKESLIAHNTDRKDLICVRTSGTSGKPFEVFITGRERKLRRLIDFRTLLNIGFRPRDHLVTLGPRIPIQRGLHERLGLFRTDQVDPLAPTAETLDQLGKLRPGFLWTYPSVFRSLLRNADQEILRKLRPHTLITSAETADPKLLRESWDGEDVAYYNFYGSIESGRIAWECPEHNGLHINADHVILELEPVSGLQHGIAAGLGHVVITTLNMRAMPFIRYRLGDLCSFVDSDCSCGSTWPTISAPIGRATSLAKLPSGRYIPAFEFTHMLRQIEWIDQFQVIQEASGSFTVNLVTTGPASDNETAQLRSRITKQLKEPVEINVRIVKQLQQNNYKLQDFLVRSADTP